MLYQYIVDIDRQVWPMLLDGGNWDHDDRALACAFASFWPSQCAVEVLGQIAFLLPQTS
jgi:hypothetical protein